MKTTKELIIADITAKVEAKLASQKVDLSLIDDLNKLTKEAKEIFNVINKTGAEIQKTQRLLINTSNQEKTLLEKYIVVIKSVDALMNKQEVIYKELGLSIREDKTYANAWNTVEHFNLKNAEFYLTLVKEVLNQKIYNQ